MSIKPVLVPDHDAAALRGLMDQFAEATTGPTRHELAESRAAVAAAQGVSEGVADTRQLLQAYAGLYYNSRESAGNDMDYDAIQQEMDQIEQQIAKQYGPAGVKKLQKYGYEQYHGRGSFDDDVVREADVTEAKPDVMRHKGDTTIRVVKRGGVPIGEIGTDSEASEGNGQYYVKLYDGSYDAVGFDTAEEALAELRYAISEGLAEGWKQKVAGAALAGAAALGAGGAQAQTTDKYDPAWGTSGYDSHIRSDRSLTRTIGSDPSKDSHDFQKRIQSVTGPNAKGEYKVVVMQGNDIVSHYVTKTPPANWLYKEEAAPQLQPRQTVWAKNTRGHWIEYEVSRVRPDGRVAVMGPGGIDVFPAELLVTQRPAGAVAESVDPIEQLRADIQRFAL